MKKYEMLLVIRPNLDMDDVEKVIQNIEETIKNYGGNVTNLDKMGRKRLAYDIQGFRDGFYVTFNIELEEKKITELKRYLKLNENVIREMIIAQVKVKTVASC